MWIPDIRPVWEWI